MVPLIFFLPGDRAGGSVVDQQVGSVDIYPTILDVLGIDVPREVDGRSLLPLIRGEDDAGQSGVWSYAAYENRGVSLRIDNQVKYIFNNSAHPEVSQSQELYQLSDDGDELTNLVDKDPETADRLRKRLVSYYQSATPSAHLMMENTGCEKVHGTIRIASLMTHLKVVEAVRGKWRNLSENHVEIDIDQGEDLRFFVESSKRIEIDLQAQGCGVDGSSAKLRRSIDVEEAKAGLFLGLADSGWKDFENSELLESAVSAATVILRGSERERGAGEDVMEEERVLEQLRSLGYIQ